MDEQTGGEARMTAIRHALARAAVCLKAAEVPFALAGGYALYAHGAAEPDHDADLIVMPSDIGRAGDALQAAGFRIEQPVEDWLIKAWSGQVSEAIFIDLIHTLGGVPVDRRLLDRCDVLPVHSVEMPVLKASEVMIAKLQVLGDHRCDFTPLLPRARLLREQIDWISVRQRLMDNAYAQAFLDLLERLTVISPES
jgi:hypothetical protein